MQQAINESIVIAGKSLQIAGAAPRAGATTADGSSVVTLSAEDLTPNMVRYLKATHGSIRTVSEVTGVPKSTLQDKISQRTSRKTLTKKSK